MVEIRLLSPVHTARHIGDEQQAAYAVHQHWADNGYILLWLRACFCADKGGARFLESAHASGGIRTTMCSSTSHPIQSFHPFLNPSNIRSYIFELVLAVVGVAVPSEG